ncbi:mannonate dehydratase [bacterium]|nr:mannonate dehydratase [bacterium]
MSLKMRVGLGQFQELTDEMLAFIKQIGADDFLMNTPRIPGESGEWAYEDLKSLKDRADGAGLRLMALENVPIDFYTDIMLAGPKRDEQIKHMVNTVRNMGKAGIPILGYHWLPNKVWRTEPLPTLRGGARATRFDASEHEPEELTHGGFYTKEEMTENFDYYLERILPVAEEADVVLALHPDDPPVDSLGGVGRIFGSFDEFRRGIDKFDSPHHKLDFCMGCWSEMNADGAVPAISHFAQRDRIAYVHLRFVQGEVPCFNECFIDEGSVDPFEAVKALHDAGFTGFLITDHVPETDGDTPWGHRGRAYALGYIRALIDWTERL